MMMLKSFDQSFAQLECDWLQSCWYLKSDVKMNAINDGLILEAQIYMLLKR